MPPFRRPGGPPPPPGVNGGPMPAEGFTPTAGFDGAFNRGYNRPQYDRGMHTRMH